MQWRPRELGAIVRRHRECLTISERPTCRHRRHLPSSHPPGLFGAVNIADRQRGRARSVRYFARREVGGGRRAVDVTVSGSIANLRLSFWPSCCPPVSPHMSNCTLVESRSRRYSLYFRQASSGGWLAVTIPRGMAAVRQPVRPPSSSTPYAQLRVSGGQAPEVLAVFSVGKQHEPVAADGAGGGRLSSLVRKTTFAPWYEGKSNVAHRLLGARHALMCMNSCLA